MKDNWLFLAILFVFTFGTATAQDSTVPDSVRQMIEQNQSSSRFEQMARMQMGVQYSDFLNALSGDAQHRSQVETVLVQVLSDRAELSSAVSSGRVRTSELEAVGNYDYLRSQLSPFLSAAELSFLDNMQGGPTDEQLKRDYSVELARMATALTEADRELVLNTLIEYIRSDREDSGELDQISVDDLVAQQSRALMRVGQDLESQLDGEKMRQVNGFLAQLQINLNRNRFMLDDAQ